MRQNIKSEPARTSGGEATDSGDSSGPLTEQVVRLLVLGLAISYTYILLR